MDVKCKNLPSPHTHRKSNIPTHTHTHKNKLNLYTTVPSLPQTRHPVDCHRYDAHIIHKYLHGNPFYAAAAPEPQHKSANNAA